MFKSKSDTVSINPVRLVATALLASGMIFGAATGSASADGRDGEGSVQMADGQRSAPAVMAAPTDVVVGTLIPEEPDGVAFAGADSLPGSYAGGTTLEAGGGHTVADDYKAGPGCMVQCITHGVAYARGVNSELRVWTDTPAYISIWVGNDDLGYSQFYSSDGDDEQYFAALFEELKPDTTYQAMATAVDAQGYVSQAFGSFTTLTRNVEISFSLAAISEQPYGNDDPFGWKAWAEGDYVDGTGADGLLIDETFLQLGQQSIKLTNVDDEYLGFGLLIWQSDSDADICGAWLLPEDPFQPGTYSCTTWSMASLLYPTNNLDERPADATSWTEHTLLRTLTQPGSADLQSSVPVVLHVTYE